MRQFVGTAKRDGFGASVVVIEENGTRRPLPHHVHHSPSGFSWGYQGSGPSELARCILWVVLNHPEAPPPSLYHQFKNEVIAHIPQNEDFTLDESYIWDWLESKGVVK